MASRTSTNRDGKDVSASNTDLLLHPELLSQDFLQLILDEKRIPVGHGDSRDRLTELYLQHVIPLPQRALPNNRWGKRMERSRARHTPASERLNSNDHGKKRPPIVFDGSSSHSSSVRLKKPEGSSISPGLSDRLKPPPSMNLSNPVRKISTSTSSSCAPSSHGSVSSGGTVDLKRHAEPSGLSSSDVKKKIHHVTWP